MKVLADSMASAVINAGMERIDISGWLFTLSDSDYQACSAAHIAAGSARAKDGKRVSINVEEVGGNMLIQHYVEQTSEPHHCLVHSISDSFSPLGRTKLLVTWELKLEKIDDNTSRLFNHVVVGATDEFISLLPSKDITDLGAIQTGMQQHVEAHNREETPLFAKDITEKARLNTWV